jgi:hypothetical protein
VIKMVKLKTKTWALIFTLMALTLGVTAVNLGVAAPWRIGPGG